MESIRKTIEVDAPLTKVYNQWTQFEEFPRFMEGVERVEQLDDKHLHWVAQVGGKRKEWDSEIVDQVPDQRISWRSTAGTRNSGVVSFQPKNGRTMVTVEIYYEAEGALEKAGQALGLLSRRIEADLERFRQFIQERRTETGAWRGAIHGRDMKTGSTNAMTAAPEYDTSGKSGLP